MTAKEKQQSVLRFVYALNSLGKEHTDLCKLAGLVGFKPEELKETISDLVSLMPWLNRKWEGLDVPEGKLYMNENGELELAQRLTGCASGSDIEVNVCGTWLKTKIETVGKTFYAAGLKGFPLVGVLARVPESEDKK